MDFTKWEPIYEQILEDFGWLRQSDEEAARFLSTLLSGKAVNSALLENTITGKDVLVCGDAPTLSRDLEHIDLKEYVILAADGATTTLLKKGIIPDIIVTDLDGNIPDEIEANRKGALMVVHAHGDNMNKLPVVRKFTRVLGTTQSSPFGNIHNFGGFTDGDRCVFLAHEFGARSIMLVGFDFEDKQVGEIKKKKLIWAKRLIGMIPGVMK